MKIEEIIEEGIMVNEKRIYEEERDERVIEEIKEVNIDNEKRFR